MITELELRQPNLFEYIGVAFQFVRTFFSWWYGDLPLSILALVKRVLVVLNDQTSFGVIFNGFFRPWRNDYNFVGWIIGIVIKLVYLPIAASLMLVTALFLLLVLAVQLVILPAIIGLIIINPFLTP